MTRLLIVGCGSIGRRHIRVFRELGVEFIGVADLRQDRLDQAKSETDLDVLVQDYRSALDQHRYDAVVITTPPHIHTAIALDAAAAGCNLFIEKPLAVNRQDSDRLIALCRERKLTAYTAYCYRFIPSVERLREILSAGTIGKVLSARLHISSYLPDWHPWEDYRDFYMAKKAEGGGALLDESHGIDLLRWLFGEISEVSAFVCNVSDLEITSDDLSVLQLRFVAGPVVQAHFDLLGRSPRIGLEVIGSTGTLLWDRIDPKISIFDAIAKEWREECFAKDDTVQSYPRQARHFLDCLKTGSETRNSLEDGRRTLEVLLAAFKSSETGRVVSVQLPETGLDGRSRYAS